MMDRTDITAVILAAGYSRRMGCFKPLLKIGKQTIIERTVSLFKDAGINDIRVVVGHCRGRIEPILEKAGIRAIINKENSPEMFSSVLATIKNLEPEVQALAILPVDIPLVRQWTIRYLIKRNRSDGDSILIPSFQGKRGHPVIMPAKYFSVIKRWTGKDGLRGALKQLADHTVSVAVADANILFDIDLPEDYEESKERWLKYTVPTREECEAILKDLAHVDEPVYAHGLAVSAVAEKICNTLVRSGCSIDCELIVAAGLLHDLAKGKPHHDQEAARLLTKIGYAEVASIVAVHTDIACFLQTPIDCAEVLYLADKLVSGDTIIPLTQRFQVALEKYGHDPEIRKKIEKRFQNAEMIQKKIEAVIGRDVINEFRQIKPRY